MCTGAPSATAAVSALWVTSFRAALPCSAMRSVVIRSSNPGTAASEDAGLDFQLLHEIGDRADLHAGLAPARLDGLQHLEPLGDVDAERLGRGLLERLLLGLHDVGERGVARLVEAKVGGDDRRQLEADGLQPAVDLARHVDGAVGDPELEREGALRPPE